MCRLGKGGDDRVTVPNDPQHNSSHWLPIHTKEITMKMLKLLVPLMLVLAVALLINVAPTAAEGPASVALGENDAVTPLACDYLPIEAASTPGFEANHFYKIPYNKGTTLVVYANATRTKNFGFDVYNPDDARIYYEIYDRKEYWQYSSAEPIGSGTKAKNYSYGDLQWVGKMEYGKENGWVLVNVWNLNDSTVWYKLCSVNK